MTIEQTTPPLWFGIDGGGSKCKAVLVNADGEILGEGISGPGNPIHGFEQATASITESAQLALNNAGLQQLSLADIPAGVGLAGVNLPKLYKQMANWAHPFAQMQLTTDLHIACLGAHQGKDGGVIIIGTGSCGYSYVNGNSLVLGAHGFPHGDKGSGAWIGLQVAKTVLLSVDGMIPQTQMTKALFQHFNCDNEIALIEQIAGKAATFYAKLAYIAFDEAKNNDEPALKIIQEGAHYIEQIARKLHTHGSHHIAMIGGLAPFLTPYLATDVQQWLVTAKLPPEMGAVLFAKQQLAESELNQKVLL